MGSDGFRAPYEAYDNTTKYVSSLHIFICSELDERGLSS